MTTRLAALLLAATSTAACVTDAGDDLDLDGLPSYDADTGGGKGDDPNCTDVTYRTFLQSYLRDEATAEANPCMWGNDASFRLWAYAAGEKLKPMLDAYSDAARKRFAGSNTREQTAAAGTLDATTKTVLAKLAAIRPAHTGKVGVAAWLEYLYKPALGAAAQPIGFGQPVPDARDQWSNEITSFEAEWLTYIEQNQPQATEPHAFTLWWEVAGPKFKSATDLLSNAIADQAAVNKMFVVRLGTTRPAGGFDEDGATYQAQITQLIAADYTSITPQPGRWDGTAALKPTGGGPLSYKTWASLFAPLAAELNTRTRTEGQREIFKLIVAARPCGSGPAVDEVVQRLTTAFATAGNDPSGTPLAQVVVPIACTPQ